MKRLSGDMASSLPLILAVLLLLGTAPQARAQSLVDGSDPQAVLDVARAYGSAALDSIANGNPRITGRIDGIGYAIYFLNCDELGCADLNFYTAFAGVKPDLETINDWNRDKRFSRAYLDSDRDAAVEMDVTIENGTTRANLDAQFAIWRLVLNQFPAHVGLD